MTHGVLEPYFRESMPDGWSVRRFVGSASVVVDSGPSGDDGLTVMIIGHADKIRMQVRRIGKDGKVWIDSDSFLPCTLIGHEVHAGTLTDLSEPNHVASGGAWHGSSTTWSCSSWSWSRRCR